MPAVQPPLYDEPERRVLAAGGNASDHSSESLVAAAMNLARSPDASSTAAPRHAGRRFGARLRAHLAARLLALVAALMPAMIAQAQIALPDFGDPARVGFSLSDERELGEAFMREVRARLNLLDDAEVARYIDSLGHRIALQSDRGGFNFFVVDDLAINAFAGPGGNIGINSGLILAAESEGELASVVAHEIAHVVQNHIARAFAKAERSSLPAMAGLIAAIIIGTQNPAAGQAAAAAVVGSQIQNQLDFTRENEQEADRVGMQLLAKADLDPRAMPTFFERLQESIRYSRQPPEYLSTHPVTTSRIADSRARAEQYAYRQFVDSQGFHLARAKLEVKSASSSREALASVEQKLESGTYGDRAAAQYARALALIGLQRYEDARAALRPLLEEEPDNTWYQSALARLELAAGNPDKALDVYSRALRLYPDDRALVRGHVEALLAVKRPRDALEVLQRFARHNTLGATLYRLQALAFEQSGQRGESLLALAEHAYLQGRLEVAIHHLEQAQRMADLDYYVGSRVDARLRELHSERTLRAER